MTLSVTISNLFFLLMAISSLGLSLSVCMNSLRCRYIACITSGGCILAIARFILICLSLVLLSIAVYPVCYCLF